MGVKRFGVALVATASIVLAYGLPARAQEAPPPPPSSPAETTSTEAGTPAPDAPPPTPTSTEPAKSDTPAPDAPPPAETTKTDTAAAESTPAPDASAEPAKTEPAKTEPTETKPAEATSAAKDAVKLEPPPPAATAPAAPAPTAAAATQAAAAPAPSATTSPVIVLVASDSAAADPAASPSGSAAEAADAAAALIVSFRPRRAPSAISLLPAVEPTVVSARPAARRAIPVKPAIRQTCARPTARVPLSADCEQARAISALRLRLASLPSSEVRAAIIRGPTRISIRREARPPPASKAAKKHPVAEVRPTAPFGSSGQGAANHSFNRSTGATSSSRILVLAAPAMRVPRPSRFVRLRVPSTIPHGVITAPPPARPG